MDRVSPSGQRRCPLSKTCGLQPIGTHKQDVRRSVRHGICKYTARPPEWPAAFVRARTRTPADGKDPRLTAVDRTYLNIAADRERRERLEAERLSLKTRGVTSFFLMRRLRPQFAVARAGPLEPLPALPTGA